MLPIIMYINSSPQRAEVTVAVIVMRPGVKRQPFQYQMEMARPEEFQSRSEGQFRLLGLRRCDLSRELSSTR